MEILEIIYCHSFIENTYEVYETGCSSARENIRFLRQISWSNYSMLTDFAFLVQDAYNLYIPGNDILLPFLPRHVHADRMQRRLHVRLDHRSEIPQDQPQRRRTNVYVPGTVRKDDEPFTNWSFQTLNPSSNEASPSTFEKQLPNRS